MPNKANRIVIVGAGVAGLSAAALLANAGHTVTVLEAQTYPGGSAGTFVHKGYRFEAGATVAGGFQPSGPHAVIADMLGIRWQVHQHDPAWVVHLPDREIALTADNADVVRHFPQTERFWAEQSRIASLCWKMSAEGLPWPPTSLPELGQLARVGLLNFPRDLEIVPLALGTAYQWLSRHGLTNDKAFVRFIDGQLLIAAQTTSHAANGVYSATALDLARQGVYHVEGGIGGLSETLAEKLESLGGQIIYRRRVTRIAVERGRVTGVYATQGKRGQKETFYPADFVIANVTPWSLDTLLGEDSPPALKRETATRADGWGAFVLHLGLQADKLPPDLPDHHQIITEMDGAFGEGRSIFISMSPLWDKSRAPEGQRAVTITTHTNVRPWWDLIEQDRAAYDNRKADYAERMIDSIERVIPGFRSSIVLNLPGTPVTYQYYTERHMGMVGGFPQTSLFKARSPRTGIPNLRLVGDSIFPGQSTAGVTLGAIRVFHDVQRALKGLSADQNHSQSTAAESRL